MAMLDKINQRPEAELSRVWGQATLDRIADHIVANPGLVNGGANTHYGLVLEFPHAYRRHDSARRAMNHIDLLRTCLPGYEVEAKVSIGFGGSDATVMLDIYREM